MNAPLNPTEIAREALRQLASHRTAPTPDNYRELYHRIAGHCGSEDEALERKLAELAKTLAGGKGPHRKLIETALARRDWSGACSALVALVENAGPSREPAVEDWSSVLRELVQALDVGHAKWTRAKKREALETLLAAKPTDAPPLAARLHSLIQSWNEGPPARALLEPEEAGAQPSAEATEELAQPLRECLAATLEVALPSLLLHAPDLAWEARTLAARARRASDSATFTQLGVDLRLFAHRIELHGGGEGALREALLRLLRLLIDNVEDLVAGDHWVQSQVAIVRNVLERPLTPEVIEEAERAIKDMMVKQGAIKRSVEEAKASLKALLQDFIERLDRTLDDTSDYHGKLDTYSERLQKTEDIAALNGIIQDLMRDTRAMQISTEQSCQALTAAREQVRAAEQRIGQMERELEHLSERAREDQLTGALNRRGLDEAFKREAGRADRQSSPLCVALLDIDNFKQLNDALGHQAGDEALLHMVGVVKEHLRPADAFARYGGEEFVILLPDTDVAGAVEVMTRLQRDLTKRFFLHNNERLLITFSCGVSQRSGGEELEPAVARADRALYQAKRAGKNRVMAAE